MNKISFVFKNKIQEIDFEKNEFKPTSTLLEFIRSQRNSKGTKEGCNEGDCGACTVVLIEKIHDKIKYRAVNSCVMFLPSIHGKQILTIEDIGNSENLHPIQKIFVDKHASQCGFCTPGFIMSLFAQKADNPNSSKEELIEAITGNLCRCTGYRPIVDCTEEITEIAETKIFTNFARIDLIESIKTDTAVEIKTESQQYFLPFTFNDAINYKKNHKDAIITNGGTDNVLRVTKRKEFFPLIIDISSIPYTQYIIEKNGKIEIGSGTKIEDIYEYSKKSLPALAEMLKLFGAKQIRNRATIGGNIGTASPIGDILPVLFAVEADIIISSDRERRVHINNFITGYRKTVLTENELIKAVSFNKPNENQIIKSYKFSKRENLDISTVSAAFNFSLNNKLITDLIIAYGGMAEKPMRATETENFLKNKLFTEHNIREAMKIIEKEFTPITDARASKEARMIMAKNMLLKFFTESHS